MGYFKKIIKVILARIGWKVVRIPPHEFRAKKQVEKRKNICLYVGSGSDRKNGYVHCDVRSLPGVDIVCRAWEVTHYCSDVEKIYSRHMLEHLSLKEVDATLQNWFAALKVDGSIHVVVPNIEYHIEQFRCAKWDDQLFTDKQSDASLRFAGLYGWQRQCDPTQRDYDKTYWDVHKSGYLPSLLVFLLKRAGFEKIELSVQDDVHLVARAVKTIANGERQVAPHLDGIRRDHCERYRFAASKIPKKSKVLDVACGVGYGAKILADEVQPLKLLAVDCNDAAIEYARRHYSHPQIQYVVGDAMVMSWEAGVYDAVVSLETIEHIKEDKIFLSKLAEALRREGVLICSTPNEDVMPYSEDRFPFHVRHYRLSDIRVRLEDAGLALEGVYSQTSAKEYKVQDGSDGSYLILVARKRL